MIVIGGEKGTVLFNSATFITGNITLTEEITNFKIITVIIGSYFVPVTIDIPSLVLYSSKTEGQNSLLLAGYKSEYCYFRISNPNNKVVTASSQGVSRIVGYK